MAALAVVVAVAVVAVVIWPAGGGGRERPAAPGPHIGSHHDAAALGRVVAAAVQDPAEGRPPSPGTTCASEVGAIYDHGLGPLVYAARLHWQGTAAVLLAYPVEGANTGGLDHRAFVVSEDGCQLLVVQTL